MGAIWKKLMKIFIISLSVTCISTCFYIYVNIFRNDPSILNNYVSVIEYKKSVETRNISSLQDLVVIVGSNYKLVKTTTPYLLILPHFIKPLVKPVTSLRRQDQDVVSQFVDLLEARRELNGVFGGTKNSPCQIQRRESTILIKNSGTKEERGYEICNITETAFVIRTEIFHRLKWRHDYGTMVSLDFFIRSEGKLKMAKLGFTFSKDVNRRDHGLWKGNKDFDGYQRFGIKNKVLRIIYEDRIEWTTCAAHFKLCKDEPINITRQQTLPYVAMPICCSQSLDRFLYDTTQALDDLGVEYRIVFGTLLGAFRSQTIIPWTYDVDIAVSRENEQSKTLFKKLQKHMGEKYKVGKLIGMNRIIPRFPTFLKADFSKILYKNTDALFSDVIRKSLQTLVPNFNKWIAGKNWRQRGYVDIYRAKFSHWMKTGTSQITINHRQYKTLKKVEHELESWFGKDFRIPIVLGNWSMRTGEGHS